MITERDILAKLWASSSAFGERTPMLVHPDTLSALQKFYAAEFPVAPVVTAKLMTEPRNRAERRAQRRAK